MLEDNCVKINMYRSLYLGGFIKMRIALIAHDKKKEDMIE